MCSTESFEVYHSCLWRTKTTKCTSYWNRVHYYFISTKGEIKNNSNLFFNHTAASIRQIKQLQTFALWLLNTVFTTCKTSLTDIILCFLQVIYSCISLPEASVTSRNLSPPLILGGHLGRHIGLCQCFRYFNMLFRY
jgi:hypothetical protein